MIDNEFIVEYIDTDGPAANGATKFNFIGRAIDNYWSSCAAFIDVIGDHRRAADGEEEKKPL